MIKTVVAALFKYLYESDGMSETVEISRDGRARAEFFGKIFSAEFYLPYERFARRQIAIGLQIPTARNLPFAFFNEFSYFFEQFGNVFLDILVQKRFVMAKYIIVLVG